MSDHAITWDHSVCFDHQEPEPWCDPAGIVTCNADPLAPCRFGCDQCEAWSYCNGVGCEHGLLRLHCDRGHPLDAQPCSAIPFFENSDLKTETYAADMADGPVYAGWPDGPIVVEFTGESYVWSYAP